MALDLWDVPMISYRNAISPLRRLSGKECGGGGFLSSGGSVALVVVVVVVVRVSNGRGNRNHPAPPESLCTCSGNLGHVTACRPAATGPERFGSLLVTLPHVLRPCKGSRLRASSKAGKRLKTQSNYECICRPIGEMEPS